MAIPADIYLDLGDRSYHIYVGSGLLARLDAYMKDLPLGRRVLLVTNPTVHSLYGELVEAILTGAGYQVIPASVPDSEESKSLDVAGQLYDTAYLEELDRHSVVIALGGGVVGDLAGFVAATYMRGVPFIQLPTTLLAQVDSSVGGKVAVNHPRGKNIIGAFYQPRLVVADMNVLATLEARELKAGLAEVIKYGVIADGAFFAWLERNLEQLLVMEPEALARAVATSCEMKAAVVQEDETEKGRRAILNFGHTLGHAIEALTGYNTYRHGEAVAIGMVAESRLASIMGLLPPAQAQRIEDLVKKAGLPVQIPGQLSADELLASMGRDKKVLDGQYTFALPVQIGRAEVFRGIPGELLRQMSG